MAIKCRTPSSIDKISALLRAYYFFTSYFIIVVCFMMCKSSSNWHPNLELTDWKTKKMYNCLGLFSRCGSSQQEFYALSRPIELSSKNTRQNNEKSLYIQVLTDLYENFLTESQFARFYRSRDTKKRK